MASLTAVADLVWLRAGGDNINHACRAPDDGGLQAWRTAALYVEIWILASHWWSRSDLKRISLASFTQPVVISPNKILQR